MTQRPSRRRYSAYAAVWSAAPQRAVFELLSDVTTWTQWAGFDEACYEYEGWERHGQGAVRRLRAGFLSSRETVLELVPDRRLTYDYAGSLPFSQYTGDVRLSPHRGGTRIEWRAEFTARHAPLGPALHWFVAQILSRLTRRLARAAERHDQRRSTHDRGDHAHTPAEHH